MSHATCAVRFNDGTILYTLFSGTTDSCHTALFMTRNEPWDLYCADDDMGEGQDADQNVEVDASALLDRTCNCDGEPVEVCADYGDGIHWDARACKKHKALLNNYGTPSGDWAEPYGMFPPDPASEPDLTEKPKPRNAPDTPGYWHYSGYPDWARSIFSHAQKLWEEEQKTDPLQLP